MLEAKCTREKRKSFAGGSMGLKILELIKMKGG